MEFSFYFWLGFFVFIVIALAIDLGLSHSEPKIISLKQASNMTAVWLLLASLFCTLIYYVSNKQKALEFITGYIVELSLSMDNVFIFVVIFSYFKIPSEYQHRVLFWGILGAVIMRFMMITGGIYLVHHFEWLFYIMGAIILYSGIKVASTKNEHGELDIDKNWLLRNLKLYLRFTPQLHKEKFWIKKGGVYYFTPLFLVLVLIEKTDLIFALDSIPAILAISKDEFIVFTSNIFAILGLRSLYFLLANLVHKFAYLKYGISLILIFIGLKMIISEAGFMHIPVHYSLFLIIAILLTSIILSMLLTKEVKNNHKR